MLRILLFIILFNLFGCNFQVIYKDQFDNTSIAHDLASIRIQKNRNQLAQKLKSNLYDVLNPDAIKTEAEFFLELKINTTINQTFTTATGASGRNKVVLNVNYVLKKISNAHIISQGSVEAYDSFDVTSNRYGTYTAEEYVKENLTKIIAQDIRNNIVNDLIENNKNQEKTKMLP